MQRVRTFVVALGLASLACDGAGAADAGVDADLPDPSLVQIPWLARGNPPIAASAERACPEGFGVERTDTGVLVCRPWPLGGPHACGGVEAHWPGEPGCARVGTACPAGEFPEGLPTDRPILYVRAGAAGGDGSRERPFGTMGQAILAAPRDVVIAVARGVYDERVDVFEGMTVWGACPEETILTRSTASEADTVVGSFYGLGRLKNLTLRAPGTMGVYAGNGASLELEDVVIDGAAGYGLYVTGVGTRATLTRVIVRGAVPFPSGNGGVGVQVIDGARAEGRNVAIEGSAAVQLVVAFDSVGSLERVVLRDARGTLPGERAGTGVAVQENGELTLRASAVWGYSSTGVLSSLGSSAVLEDVAIEESSEPIGVSHALEVRVGSTLTGSFVLVEGARGAALASSEDGAFVLSDLVVRDTRPLLGSADDEEGAALSVEGRSSATLTRALFERSVRSGVVTQADARLVANDLVVRDVAGGGRRGIGVGLALFGAEHVIERAVVERATLGGVVISESPRSLLRDVVVRDTQGEPERGEYGRGLEISIGSVVEAERVVLERNREVSLYAFDSETRVTMRELYVRDSLGQQCGDSCADGQQYGYGITVRGAHLELDGFVVTRSRVLGLQVAEGGRIVGRRGEVSESRIGINVQDPEFDYASALSDVAFRDNERNVDAMFLPLPDTTLSDDL